SAGGLHDGGHYPPDDDQTGARPRGGVERDDYRHHRYRRFLYFSWACNDFSSLSRRLSRAGSNAITIIPPSTPMARLPVETVAATVISITTVSAMGALFNVAG